MNDKKKIIEALKILRRECPAYFNDVLMADCPSDLGLPAEYVTWCGKDGDGTDFVFDYCERCWNEAMKEVKP